MVIERARNCLIGRDDSHSMPPQRDFAVENSILERARIDQSHSREQSEEFPPHSVA
jgi:hypothetical protein